MSWSKVGAGSIRFTISSQMVAYCIQMTAVDLFGMQIVHICAFALANKWIETVYYII